MLYGGARVAFIAAASSFEVDAKPRTAGGVVDADVASTKSIDRSKGIDAKIQDQDMDDLMGLVAYDLRK